jgi:hypothetical protein
METGMKTFLKVISGFALAVASLASTPAFALVGYADQVVDYFDSGKGPIPGPYGGLNGASSPDLTPVPTSVVLGKDVVDSETFLSLPTDSYIIVGFTDERVFDGSGNDIFIQEIGAAGDRADVFVSSDGSNFSFLGRATDSGTTAFDLSTIGFETDANFVKIVGLDTRGTSPGFDVVNVQGLPGSTAPVPEPAASAMLMGGLALIAFISRHRRVYLGGSKNFKVTST